MPDYEIEEALYSLVEGIQGMTKVSFFTLFFSYPHSCSAYRQSGYDDRIPGPSNNCINLHLRGNASQRRHCVWGQETRD